MEVGSESKGFPVQASSVSVLVWVGFLFAAVFGEG